jgi:hypothetical protein
MDFLSDFHSLVVLVVALAIASCLYVNRSLLTDIVKKRDTDSESRAPPAAAGATQVME